MRRNPYSTGYVAAKIRENTARRNGSDVVDMQQAKRDADQLYRWLEEDGAAYEGAHVDCLRDALLHQLFDLPVTRESSLKLSEALMAAPEGSALASAFRLAEDKAMREISRSR